MLESCGRFLFLTPPTPHVHPSTHPPTHPPLQVACALLESCGRFLFLTPHTHVRLKTYLDIFKKLKVVKNVDPSLEVGGWVVGWVGAWVGGWV